MKDEIYFSVRPRPKYNESFIGYCLRIAKVNGRHYLKELNSVAGVATSKYLHTVSHKSCDAFMEKLAPLLKLSRRDLKEHFYNYESQSLFVNKNNYIQSTRCWTPKVCPVCITENEMMKTDWLHLHYTHCEDHQLQLIDECPCCQFKLDWSVDTFDRCPSCDQKWSQMSFEYSTVPLYQSVLSQAIALENIDLVEAFSAAFAVALRPNDFVISPVPSIDISILEAHQWSLQAYALLESASFARHWVKQYEKAGHLTPFLDYKPMLHFLKEKRSKFSLKTEVHHHIPFQRMESDQAVRPYRKKLSHMAPLTRQVGLQEASTFLGLDSKDFDTLVECKVISPIHESYFLSDTLFDLEHLVDLDLNVWAKAHPLHNQKNTMALVSLADLFADVMFFGVTPADLIKACLNEATIPFYSEGGAHWYELMANKFDFLAWLEKIYLRYLPDEINVDTFRTMIGANEKQCRELVRKSDLNFKPWVKSDVISKTVLSEFMTSNTILGQYAALYGLCPEYAMDALKAKGIEPLYLPKKGSAAAIYRKENLNMKNFHQVFYESLNLEIVA